MINNNALVNIIADARAYHHVLLFEKQKRTYKQKEKKRQQMELIEYHKEKITEYTILINMLKEKGL